MREDMQDIGIAPETIFPGGGFASASLETKTTKTP